MKRKPIPLHMLDTLNAYQLSGRVVSVYPYKGMMSLNGGAAISYVEAFQRMRERMIAESGK